MTINIDAKTWQRNPSQVSGGRFYSDVDKVPASGLVDGQTITLTGTFDAMTDATPRIFDRFNGTVGNDLTGYTLSNNAGVNPKYAADAGRIFDTAIGKAAKMSFLDADGQYNCTAELTTLAGQTKLFVAYHVFVDKISGVNSRNVKLLRVSGGYDGAYQEPLIGHTSQYDNGQGTDYYDAGSGVVVDYNGIVTAGQWSRIAMYADLGTAGSANGKFKVWRGQTLATDLSNAQMRNTGVGGFNWVTLPYYVAHDDNVGSPVVLDYAIYASHLYVGREEHEQARIELSNSATYTGGDLVVQPMVSCSSGALQFTLAKGSLDLSQPVYAYYTNKAGTTTAMGAV